MLQRYASVSLRAFGLAGRFLLYISLGYFLSPDDLGRFGIIAATLTFMVYILGADFYIVANRELCIVPEAQRAAVIKRSAPVFSGTYVLSVPILVWLFYMGYLPVEMAHLVILALVLEHLGQEIYRILIALQRPVLASLSIFLRLGAWAFAISLLMAFDASLRTLETVMLAWVLGALAALAVGLGTIIRLPASGWRAAIDMAWVRQGLKIALPFLLATLSLRSLGTFDRMIMSGLTSEATVGAYVLYAGIGASIPALIDAALISFAMPSLIRWANTGEAAAYDAAFRQLRRRCYIATGLLSCGAGLAIVLVAFLFDHPIYRDNLDMAFIVLLAFAISSVTAVYNLDLYAHHRDRSIILSHIAGVAMFFLAVLLLQTVLERLAVPCALILGQITILAIKVLGVQRRRDAGTTGR